MAELLSRWINQDVGLSIPIQSFERDFSNGYYFGELLCKLQLIGEDEFYVNFVNNPHPHTLTANFGILSSLVKNMGIKFDAKLAKDIMNGTAGAALRLLYQIKMAMQKRELQASGLNQPASKALQSPTKSRTQTLTGLPPVAGALERPMTSTSISFHPSGANALPPTLISPKGHQPTRPLDRLENRRLAENLLQMTHMNAKEKHMQMHLSRFEKRAHDQEEKQQAEARAEDEARAQLLRQQQAESREKLQQNQAYNRSWNASGMQVWRSNMNRIDATKQARSKWNATIQHQQQERTQLLTHEKEYEVRSGIDEFEKNLERIGAGGESSGLLDDASTIADQTEVSAVQHITTKLAHTLGSPAALAKQSTEHMNRIHEKCVNDGLARKERDRRRRKVLVEQAAEAEELDRKKQEELFLEKMKKESEEERAIGEEVWRTEQYHAILSQNAAYRAQQEALVREERQQQTRRRNQAAYDAAKREHERQLASELARFEEIRTQIAEEKHEENMIYGQELVQRLIDVSYKAACFREVSEQALIPPPMWREWMNLFVQGLPLLPQRDNSTTSLSMVDNILASVNSATDDETNLRLEAGAPSALLSAMTLSEKVKPATTIKSPGASKKDGASSSSSATDLDSQTLTHESFYETLYQNREVGSLVANLRDVNEQTATVLDETALEDYLAGKNEWSYDIQQVVPPELVNERSEEAAAAAAASPSPRSASVASNRESEKKLGTSSSKKLKDVPAAPIEPEIQSYTSLSFLGPLHPADQANLSEPFREEEKSNAAVVPANQNPLFGALLQRILDVASGKEQPPDLPEVPRFPLSIVLLGKPFSGKKTQAALLAEKFGLEIFQTDELVKRGVEELDALEVSQAAEKLSARTKKAAGDGSTSSRKSLKPPPKTPYQLLLVKLKKLLAKSEPVTDEIYVGLIVEAIKNLPAKVAAKKADYEQTLLARREQATDPMTGEVIQELVPDEPTPLFAGEGGFVLLNFPNTLQQAKLLEQALTGFELPKAPTAKSTGAPKLGKTKASKLSSKIAAAPGTGVVGSVFNGLVAENGLPFPSGLDLVIRLDQSNEVLLRRARGLRVDPLTGKVFHLDYAQPTELDLNASVVSTANGGKTEPSHLKSRLVAPQSSLDVNASLPEQFLNYEANEKELQEWFQAFGTLQIVSGANDVNDSNSSDQLPTIADIREAIRTIVRQRMVEIDIRKAKEDQERLLKAQQDALAAGEVSVIPQHPLEASALEQAAASVPPPPTDAELAAAAANAVSPVSSKKGDKSQPIEPEYVPPAYTYPTFTPTELLSFSESGFYDLELSNFLSKKWIRCEKYYLKYSKHVFRSLRSLRAQGLEYFATTRKNFFTFLRRTDSKQLLLDQFQTSFNAIPQDLRADVATKEELHMRLDELSEQLWKINSQKHDENEQEFARIAGTNSATGQNEFLDSLIASYYFYYALLMQLELDRYFQSIRIAQDFFTSLKGQVIYDEKERDEKEMKKAGKTNADELKTGEPLGVPIKGGLGLKLHINLPLALSQMKEKAKEKTKKKDSTTASPALSASSSATSSKKAIRGASSAASSKKRFTPSSTIEDDPFQELIDILVNNFIQPEELLEQINAGQDLESWTNSLGAVPTKGKSSKAAAAAKPGTAAKPPTTPNTSQAPPRTGSGKRRAAKGLGSTQQLTSTTSSKPTREALLDAQLYQLIQNENRLLSARIRRIHRNAQIDIQQLRSYNDKVFLDRLDHYLSLRIKGESNALDALIYHIQVTYIEGELPIQTYLRLDGENFFIDADVLNVPDEQSLKPDYTMFNDLFDPLYTTRFTLPQLLHLTNTLKSLSIGGSTGLDVKVTELYQVFLQSYHASQTSQATIANAFPIPGENGLPVKWSPSNVSPDGKNAASMQTQSYFRQLISLFAGAASTNSSSSAAPTFQRAYIDFRDFLLNITLLDSIVTPSLSQLLHMQQELIALDRDEDGQVTWEEFSQLKLWFELGSSGQEVDDPILSQAQMESKKRTEEPIKRLKEFFFHLFSFEYVRPSGESGVGPIKLFLLSHIDFLSYLCFNDDSDSTLASPISHSNPHAPRTGLEKAQLLLANVSPKQYGELTPTFIARYIQGQASSPAGGRATILSTTPLEKFTRKDLTRATQQL